MNDQKIEKTKNIYFYIIQTSLSEYFDCASQDLTLPFFLAVVYTKYSNKWDANKETSFVTPLTQNLIKKVQEMDGEVINTEDWLGLSKNLKNKIKKEEIQNVIFHCDLIESESSNREFFFDKSTRFVLNEKSFALAKKQQLNILQEYLNYLKELKEIEFKKISLKKNILDLEKAIASFGEFQAYCLNGKIYQLKTDYYDDRAKVLDIRNFDYSDLIGE